MAPPIPSFEEALADLGALLVAIQPYRDDLVLCGGFAAWLYRAHPDFAPAHGAHPITLDIVHRVMSTALSQTGLSKT